MSRRRKVVFAAFAALVLVAAAALAAVLTRGEHESLKQERMREARMLLKSAASPGRVDKVGDGEADRSGGKSPAVEEYENRAFPNANIAFAQTESSIKAARQILKHTGTRFPRPWEEIGPDTLDVDTLGTQTFGPPTQWSGRETALAVAPKCNEHSCRLYVAAAGGGIWMTHNALSRHPTWQQISDGGIPTTAIGSMLIDPTDPSGRTIYVGTGEPNGSSDSEAGLGLYKSTDGGRHWSLVPGSWDVAKDRAIGAIAIDPNNPNHIWIGTDVARHGLSSRSGGRYTPPDGRTPPLGLYESKDGGATFSANTIKPQDTVNPASANGGDFYKGGVTSIQYDPSDPSTLYFTIWDYGLFRSNDNGATNAQIYTGEPDPLGSGIRYEFAPAKLPNGNTR